MCLRVGSGVFASHCTQWVHKGGSALCMYLSSSFWGSRLAGSSCSDGTKARGQRKHTWLRTGLRTDTDTSNCVSLARARTRPSPKSRDKFCLEWGYGQSMEEARDKELVPKIQFTIGANKSTFSLHCPANSLRKCVPNTCVWLRPLREWQGT